MNSSLSQCFCQSAHLTIMPYQFKRLSIAILAASCFLAGCSESTPNAQPSAEVVTPAASNNNDSNGLSDESQPATDVITNDANDIVDAGDATTNEVVDDIQVIVDPLIQNQTLVSFDITVPAYQSVELSVELVWGDITLAAGWVGDEYWSVFGEFPTETEELLTISFYDRNGEITLARFSNNFRTGSNATESFQISADQFDASQFDDDEDGVSNLDELLSGTDPLINEDLELEILDYYALSGISTSRMSVSSSFEGLLTDERPYYYYSERLPVPDGYPGTQSSTIDIDADGNGTRIFRETLQGTILELDGTRTNTGNTITWEGTRYAYDGDYGHRVSFTNTVAVVDETTRSFVEEIVGSNGGTYQFGWNVSSNLTGRIVEGSSFCKPVAGTVSETYRANYWGDDGVTTTLTTVSKEIDDLYWRVKIVFDDNETSEYFARELVIYRRNNSASAEPEPELKYFICDFVDF